MMISRRTFILSTTLFATTPVFARLLSLSSTMPSNGAPLQDQLPLQLAAGAADVNYPLFKIAGWDRYYDIAKPSPADPVTHTRADEQSWININRSWRAVWR